MPGDYTRFTYKPRKRYSGVLMQQGRVQLDADWNEQGAIAARRWRVQALDTFGPAAVSALSAEDAFKVDPLAAGLDFSLGAGRLYVDGLIAEIFPAESVTYLGQTNLFYPQPPALPASGSALVYLDVWERELTYVQDPDLLEIALGGPDTTTRTQTAWQVKVTTAAADCDADLDQLFPPSAGRLTTDANAPPASDDPCLLSPAGGYRGLENRLYRVEIHRGGPLGTAKFKWSRDNASIVSAVSEIAVSGSQTTLKVSRIGRDAVLRFRKDDWVELTDDHRELMGEPGETAKVLDADEATLTVLIDRAVPTAGARAFAASKTGHEARHTRLVRWDQKESINALDADGLMTTGAAQVQLEDGVFVTFSGGAMKVGDHWLFAARTADASVEKLDAAPPRGIVHHYAPLAAISIANNAVRLEQDCRTQWPPGGGCCTVVVKPGEDIQRAIDSLPAEGGCVCLKTGVHVVGAPIRIDRSRVILHGESPGTIVRASGFAPRETRPALLLDVHAASVRVADIRVQDIRFELDGTLEAFATAIRLEACDRVAIRRCAVLAADLSGLYAAIDVADASELSIAENRSAGTLMGVYVDDYSERLEIVDNRFRGAVYRLPDTLPGSPEGELSVGLYGLYVDAEGAAPCRIENNLIEHFQTGVHVVGEADGSVVADNSILRSIAADNSPLPDTAEKLRDYADQRAYAIQVRAGGCTVRGNRIALRSSAQGGIKTSGGHAIVEGNLIDAQMGDEFALNPVGICCIDNEALKRAAHHAQVRGNLLTGAQIGIYVHGCDAVTIAHNHVDAAARGWYGIRCDEAPEVTIDGNELRGCLLAAIYLTNGERSRLIDNRIADAFVGAMLSGETGPELRGNHLTGGRWGGVLLAFKRNAVFAGNRIANCGFLASSILNFGLSAGNEEFLATEAQLQVDGCEILDTGVSSDGNERSAGLVHGLLGIGVSARITGNRIGYTRPPALSETEEHRALLLLGPLSVRYSFGAFEFEFTTGSALIAGNLLDGPGRTHLVELYRLVIIEQAGFRIDTRHEKTSFSDNICRHGPAASGQEGATVKLWGSHQVAMGNQVKGPEGVNAFDLSSRPTMLIGNTATGAVINAGGARPVPITDFNLML